MAEGIQLRDKVLRNLAVQGEAGAAWLKNLPTVIRGLETRWNISVGRTLPNATEAYVAEAITANGTEVVLKISIVGLKKTEREIRVLQAADGRGYVRLLESDAASGAMLLERLGPQLARQGLPIHDQIAIICSTLKRAWMAPRPDLPLLNGAEKASEMASYITSAWAKLQTPCSEKAVQVALRFADTRASAFDPATAVISHGDAHAWNTLIDPKSSDYKFVDPDGLFIERAHDLSIMLRESCGEFISGDPVALGRARCAFLSGLTGVDQEAIWQWGLIESLVNGLLYKEVGSAENAAPLLLVAEAWAAAEK